MTPSKEETSDEVGILALLLVFLWASRPARLVDNSSSPCGIGVLDLGEDSCVRLNLLFLLGQQSPGESARCQVSLKVLGSRDGVLGVRRSCEATGRCWEESHPPAQKLLLNSDSPAPVL